MNASAARRARSSALPETYRWPCMRIAARSLSRQQEHSRFVLEALSLWTRIRSEAQERIVQAGVRFAADAEPAEWAARRTSAPAHAAESAAVRATATGDQWFDASAPQLSAV